MERVNHATEALRLIDQTLLEESTKLDELKQIVKENGTQYSEEQLVCGWFHNYKYGSCQTDAPTI